MCFCISNHRALKYWKITPLFPKHKVITQFAIAKLQIYLKKYLVYIRMSSGVELELKPFTPIEGRILVSVSVSQTV